MALGMAMILLGPEESHSSKNPSCCDPRGSSAVFSAPTHGEGCGGTVLSLHLLGAPLGTLPSLC